jgi:hypothetical protein
MDGEAHDGSRSNPLRKKSDESVHLPDFNGAIASGGYKLFQERMVFQRSDGTGVTGLDNELRFAKAQKRSGQEKYEGARSAFHTSSHEYNLFREM